MALQRNCTVALLQLQCSFIPCCSLQRRLMSFSKKKKNDLQTQGRQVIITRAYATLYHWAIYGGGREAVGLQVNFLFFIFFLFFYFLFLKISQVFVSYCSTVQNRNVATVRYSAISLQCHSRSIRKHSHSELCRTLIIIFFLVSIVFPNFIYMGKDFESDAHVHFNRKIFYENIVQGQMQPCSCQSIKKKKKKKNLVQLRVGSESS